MCLFSYEYELYLQAANVSSVKRRHRTTSKMKIMLLYELLFPHSIFSGSSFLSHKMRCQFLHIMKWSHICCLELTTVECPFHLHSSKIELANIFFAVELGHRRTNTYIHIAKSCRRMAVTSNCVAHATCSTVRNPCSNN